MIDVKITAITKVINDEDDNITVETVFSDPEALASHAARKCYRAERPLIGDLINVFKETFQPGHHTVIQHFFYTFDIEKLSIGDVTFGIHLAHPFYNSGQRSGRFCKEMFANPNFNELEEYIRLFWGPQIPKSTIGHIMKYLRYLAEVYNSNLAKAIACTDKRLRIERPNASDKYILDKAPRVAQEQLRMFMPVIFPTGLDYTINESALFAMYASAFSPPMRYLLECMKTEVLNKNPELDKYFCAEKQRSTDWSPPKPSIMGEIVYKPRLELTRIPEDIIIPSHKVTFPIDKLHFTPEMMDNNVKNFEMNIEISVATMGQDQRHRTIRRSMPIFTGNFYLPPIVRNIGLEKDAVRAMKWFLDLAEYLPGTLSTILAPYGAMVKYAKSGSANAIIHEMAKRLDFNAQEEIYHLARIFRSQYKERVKNSTKILKLLSPHCFSFKKCGEGRYCGREMNYGGDYFPEREV